MKLMVSSYNNGGATWNAEAEETKLRSYSIDHKFNGPAKCTIVLADVDGSMIQKYNTDANDVYLGVGKITLEDPTGTDIFYGRILKAIGNSADRTLTLECVDWLDQLDEERITYDMREDLDGSGLRQSALKSFVDREDDGTHTMAPAYTSGANYYVFDDDMDWTVDQFNSMSLILPVEAFGEKTITMWPYTASSTGGTNPLWYAWKDTTSVHSESAAANFTSEYSFKVIQGNNTSSTLYDDDSISKVEIEAWWRTTGLDHFDIQIWDGDSWEDIQTEITPSSVNTRTTWTVPEDLVSTAVDSDGILKIRFNCDWDGAGTDYMYILYIEARVTVQVNGYSTAPTISDTKLTGIEKFIIGVNENDSIDYAELYEDGVGYTTKTVALNSTTTADVQMLPQPLSQNDAFYIGRTANTFEGIRIDISTASDHDGSLAWQYWDGSSWSSLPSVTDETNALKTTGENLWVWWSMPSDWATTAVDGDTAYWIRCIIVDALPAQTVAPVASIAYTMEYGNCLKVSVDCSSSGLGLYEGCPYSIVKPIYLHLEAATGPILGGDTVVTLTAGAANIENTSGISSRQYKNRTRLEILRDLAEQDKALFWITLGTSTVTYQQTFGADVAQLTDGKVISWQSLQDYSSMFNSIDVYGARLGDYEVYQQSETAASITKFLNTKSKVIRRAGLVSEVDALAIGTAIAAKESDVQQMVGCVIVGNTATAAHDTTIKLGDVVEITSSYLWSTAAKDYIVTRWTYNSRDHQTTLTLHPKVSIGLQDIDSLDNRENRLREQVIDAQIEKYITDPVTHEVS